MIEKFLADNEIPFQRVEHPPVFTCEEAKIHMPDLPGAETKNLFLRDGKGKRHFLLVTSTNSNVDLKMLSGMLEVKGLGFASPDRLKKYLGVEPGSVTLLALINDTSHSVELLMDEEVWKHEAIQCHPLINTATMVIQRADVEKFFRMTGHAAEIVRLPKT